MDDLQPATTSDEPDLNWLSVCLLTLAALSIGIGINIREGLFCRGALICLTVAIVAALASVMRFRIRPAPWQRYAPAAILLAAVAVQFVQIYQSYPGALWNTRPGTPHHQLSIEKDDATWIKDPAKRGAAKAHIAQTESRLIDTSFRAGLVAAALLSALCIINPRWGLRFIMPIVLAIHFLLGAWLIHRTPDPFIDVYVFQQESCAALLHGKNPYDTTFTNIYGQGAYVYAPGLMKDGRVNFGYPYMPLSLFMALPGYLLGGDHRYSQLAAITLAGALLVFARPGLAAILAALLLLFTPRVFMIAELGWTEPFVVLLLAATVFCASRFPRAAPYVLGLLLASKQYTILLIPLAVLLIPRPFRWRNCLRLMLKAGIVAAAVSLPLVLWNWRAFTWSAVTLQLKQPFRNDSISYLAWLAWQNWRYAQPVAAKLAVLAFVAAIAAIALALRRCPRTPAGFAVGVSLVYLAFLALNKQAFCNYYFLVIGAFCSAIAATRPPCACAPTLPPSSSLSQP